MAWPQGWIGGWLLPQEASYFALALPHGWWLFGLDLALDHDIDMCQTRCDCSTPGIRTACPVVAAVLCFAPPCSNRGGQGAPAPCVQHVPTPSGAPRRYFARVAEERMGPDDAAVLVTHAPLWLSAWCVSACLHPRCSQLDAHRLAIEGEGRVLIVFCKPLRYEGEPRAHNLRQLVRGHLRGRARVHLAGDLHFYMRYGTAYPPHLADCIVTRLRYVCAEAISAQLCAFG